MFPVLPCFPFNSDDFYRNLSRRTGVRPIFGGITIDGFDEKTSGLVKKVRDEICQEIKSNIKSVEIHTISDRHFIAVMHDAKQDSALDTTFPQNGPNPGSIQKHYFERHGVKGVMLWYPEWCHSRREVKKIIKERKQQAISDGYTEN